MLTSRWAACAELHSRQYQCAGVGASRQWRSEKKEPVILLTDFGSSSVDFEVSVWIEDPWRSRRGRSDLCQAIRWALKEAGITIAFPQVDVHFDTPVVESLEGLKRAV